MNVKVIRALVTVTILATALVLLSACAGKQIPVSAFERNAENAITTCNDSGVKKVEVNYKREVIRAECKEDETSFWDE